MTDFKKIIENKKLFEDTIYTPLSEAIKILESRKKDHKIKDQVEKLLGNNIPKIFKKNGNNCYQFRQVATPNYEGQWFIKIARSLGLKPNFCEFHDDKFTTNNNFKLSLGQIKIHHGFKKDGEVILEKINIIDLKKNDGKKLKEVNTNWSENLIDFHKKLFKLYKFDTKGIDCSDLSAWHNEIANNPFDSYVKVFLLFITHGILFENFLTYGKESIFTKEVVLPAFEEVKKLTGLKPLIVPIPPMDKEYDDYIVYHKPIIKKVIPL